MRSKEMAHDYRYFPEPDLQPVIISHEYINSIRSKLPALPNDLFKKYTKQLELSAYDAGVLTDNKQMALYFEELITKTKNYKAAANWMMGAVKSYLNENAIEIEQFSLTPAAVAQIIELIDSGKISNSVASQKVFPELVRSPQKTAMQIAQEQNLLQESDEGSLKELAKQAISKYPEKVAEYKSGKIGLLGLFMGELMKLSKGKADPKIASQLVKQLLDEN